MPAETSFDLFLFPTFVSIGVTTIWEHRFVVNFALISTSLLYVSRWVGTFTRAIDGHSTLSNGEAATSRPKIQ